MLSIPPWTNLVMLVVLDWPFTIVAFFIIIIVNDLTKIMAVKTIFPFFIIVNVSGINPIS